MGAVVAGSALAPAAGAATSTGTTGATGLTGVTSPVGTTGATTPTTPTKPVKPSKPAPRAVKSNATIALPTIYVLHKDDVTVPERPVSVKGTVRPFVPGQHVRVRAFQDGKLIKSATVRVSKAQGGGHFATTVKAPKPGTVTIKVSHQRNAAMQGFEAARKYSVLNPDVHYGSTGWFVQLMQQRLAFLHLYIPQTGVWDNGTNLALDAYHRILGWGEGNTNLDGKTISYLLNGWGEFKVKYPSQGRHAEGNLGTQTLALIDGSKVQMIFPISSGKPSTPTIQGSYRVYERVPGYLPDGMYYSDFFIRGYAIHGYDPAPDYPASHGCFRLPIVDAITAFNWLAMGDWVDSYYP